MSQKKSNNDVNDLTLRDIFAGFVAAGLLAHDGYNRAIPVQAYMIADDLILEREKDES